MLIDKKIASVETIQFSKLLYYNIKTGETSNKVYELEGYLLFDLYNLYLPYPFFLQIRSACSGVGTWRMIRSST